MITETVKMMKAWSSTSIVAVCLCLLLECGCSRAPAIDVAGSFLPSWMLCFAFGVIVAGITRWQLIRRKLEKRVMPLVIFYPSLIVAGAGLMWLVFFR